MTTDGLSGALRGVMVAALLALSTPASAFQLLPMAIELAPAGGDATQTFALHNEAEKPVAVQLSIAKRDVAPDGKETLAPAPAEFLVFPPQAVIGPGKTQLVQVRWIGTPTLNRELSFRLIAEQLPVSLEEGQQQGGRIDILLRYEAALYVKPQGAAPDVVVDAVATAQSPDGPRLAVTLRNAGSAHGVLNDPVLTVRGKSADGRAVSLDLQKDALGDMRSVNILAGARREFLLPLPKDLAAPDATATLRTTYVQ